MACQQRPRKAAIHTPASPSLQRVLSFVVATWKLNWQWQNQALTGQNYPWATSFSDLSMEDSRPTRHSCLQSVHLRAYLRAAVTSGLPRSHCPSLHGPSNSAHLSLHPHAPAAQSILLSRNLPQHRTNSSGQRWLAGAPDRPSGDW